MKKNSAASHLRKTDKNDTTNKPQPTQGYLVDVLALQQIHTELVLLPEAAQTLTDWLDHDVVQRQKGTGADTLFFQISNAFLGGKGRLHHLKLSENAENE